MKIYDHIIDTNGEHWLRDESLNYFNGISWEAANSLNMTEIIYVGQCTLPEFLIELETSINYRDAL